MQILAVVVRYNTPIDESETLRGLCAALSLEPDLAQGYKLLIWDNSPEALVDPELPISFSYRHSERNLGVSGAYNSAMQYALEHGHTWMLLLDQDTKITAEFLQMMFRHALELEGRSEIAAIAPIVKVGCIVMSPKKYTFGRTVTYSIGDSGILPKEATAINSGCLMRVSALREIGCFSTEFWLDYSDIYVFHQYYLYGKKVWRAADVELEHEMSIMDYDRLMTPWRYRNFNAAESAFLDLFKGRTENAIQNLRLFVRAIKQWFKYENPEFSQIAWATFRYRMTTSRKYRIAKWKAESAKREE